MGAAIYCLKLFIARRQAAPEIEVCIPKAMSPRAQPKQLPEKPLDMARFLFTPGYPFRSDCRDCQYKLGLASPLSL